MNVLVLTSSMTVAGTLPTTTKVLTVKAPRITSLCTEGAVTGFVVGLPVGGTTVIVASDGESRFDPWGFGADTIEQIALPRLHNSTVRRREHLLLPGCVSGVCENGSRSLLVTGMPLAMSGTSVV